MFYRLVRLFFTFCLRVFYRLEIGGTPPPDDRPVLFCGNHPNGLLDPALVLAASTRPIRFMAKAPLLKMPVIGWILRGVRAVPVFRTQDGADTASNAKSFEAVVDALAQGGAVCIFPEGTSHSVPRLLALKTGAARIALLTSAKRPAARGLLVVPIGVTYAEKHSFRSRALCVFGRPIEAAPFLTDPRPEEERVRALTASIRAGLQEVSIELDRTDELALLRRVAALYAEARQLPERGRELGPAFPRWKWLLEGVSWHRTRSPARLAALRRRIEAWLARLDRLGLAEDALDRRPSTGAVLSFLAVRLLPLALTAPLAVLGAAIFWLPWRLPGWLVGLKGVGLDVVASVKLLAGILFGLLTWAAFVALVAWQLGLPEAAGTFVLLPPLALLALAWGHAAEEAAEDLGIFLRLFGREGLRGRLVARRAAIADEIDALAAEAAAAAREEEEE